MIDSSFLKLLDRLSLILNKKVTSNYTGERESKHTGHGMVFKDYIIYSPGDDFRSIDWKVLARTDKLFSRRYEEERNLTVHIIIDTSASMNFGSGKVKKFDYASEIGIGFSYMALKNNERFVISTFSDSLDVFKPRKGREQLVHIMDFLNKKGAKGVSNFEASLTKYKKLINSKSLVVIVSDFLYPSAEIAAVLHKLRRHDVRLIQVLDPVEAELNLDGDYKLKDNETNEVMRTFISPALRKQYLTQMADHQANIKKTCDEIGARFYPFSTSTPIFDAFAYVLQPDHHRRA